MGHHADRFTVTDDTSGTKYFLTTGSSTPFRRKFLALPVLGQPEVTETLKKSFLMTENFDCLCAVWTCVSLYGVRLVVNAHLEGSAGRISSLGGRCAA